MRVVVFVNIKIYFLTASEIGPTTPNSHLLPSALLDRPLLLDHFSLSLSVLLRRKQNRIVKHPRIGPQSLYCRSVSVSVGLVDCFVQWRLLGEELQERSPGCVRAWGVVCIVILLGKYNIDDLLNILVADLLPVDNVSPSLLHVLDQLRSHLLDLLFL